MIIGLSGYGRSGKDSVAQILGDVYDFKRYAFADAVRDMALAIDPWVEIPYHGFRRLAYVVDDLGWEQAKAYSDVRSSLQHIGMAGRKEIHEDVWLDIVRERVADDNLPGAVITDVRFGNEADWIDRDGFLVRVSRPGYGPVNGHHSETEVDDREPVYGLINDGDLDDLTTQVKAMVEVLRLVEHVQ